MAARSFRTRSGGFWALRVVSLLELLSLALIVTNRFTIHSPAITSTGGPLHGLLYVSTIVLGLLLPIPRSAKWFAVVPGFGGLLALWRARIAVRANTGESAGGEGGTPRRIALSAEERENAAIVVDGATGMLSAARRIGPLSFTVASRGITGVIGPNGAGKTTALRMLCGLVSPFGGVIEIHPEGTAVDPARGGARGTSSPMGVLIDSPGFIPGMTARENLLALTRLAGWPAGLVDPALHRVGLRDEAGQRVSAFSLGMKQRLGLAAALLGGPRIVIIDEPTNGLDPRGMIELRAFLRGLRDEGITIVLASHALDEIEELCDHLVAMDHGQVLFNGPPAALLATIPATIRCRMSPAETGRVREALECAGYVVELVDAETLRVAAPPDSGAVLNGLAARCGVLMTEIVPERPSLEEAFLELTGEYSSERIDPAGRAEVVR